MRKARNKKNRKTPYGIEESMNIENDQPSLSNSTISFKDIKSLLNGEISLNDLLKFKDEAEDIKTEDGEKKTFGNLVRVQRLEYKMFVRKRNEIRELM